MSMRERIKPTRSGLFAIELLISIGVFSLCAAICVGLFVRSGRQRGPKRGGVL